MHDTCYYVVSPKSPKSCYIIQRSLRKFRAIMKEKDMEYSGPSTVLHYSNYDSHDSSDDDQLFASHSNLSASNSDHVNFIKPTEELVESSLLYEVNRTIEEQFGKTLHLVDGSSSILSQLESTTRQLENSVDSLMVCAEYINRNIDGKLRQIESTLREVKDGICFIRDKQEITEAKFQLAKLQDFNVTKSPKYDMLVLPSDPMLQPPILISMQSPQLVLNSNLLSPSLPTPLASLTPLYQNTISQETSITSSQYNEPHFPQVLKPLRYLQEHSAFGSDNLDSQTLGANITEEKPYIQPYTWQPNTQQTSFQRTKEPRPPIQPFYGYSQQFEKPEPEFSFVPWPTKFGTDIPIIKPSQVNYGYSNLDELHKAEEIPHALPTASFLESGLSSGLSVKVENKGPLDEVDKITSMGFRRDIVRATAKKLTDNGLALVFFSGI